MNYIINRFNFFHHCMGYFHSPSVYLEHSYLGFYYPLPETSENPGRVTGKLYATNLLVIEFEALYTLTCTNIIIYPECIMIKLLFIHVWYTAGFNINF